MYAHEERGSSPELSTAAAAAGDVEPSPKRSGRRSAQKRVVSLPAPETEGGRLKPGSEAAPPPDSWAWRKYGQKPIKGSPYPRGYYRCSSSKGCPARKQVERSRTDPTMFVVTYSSDHNHSWPPISRNHHHHSPAAGGGGAARKTAEDLTPADTSPTEPVSDPDEKFADLIAEEPSLLMPDDFRWPPHSSPAADDDGLLYGPLFGGAPLCDDGMVVDEEEDALFAGLGELPECSVIFRRAVLDRQIRRGEKGKRFGLDVAVAAAGGAAS